MRIRNKPKPNKAALPTLLNPEAEQRRIDSIEQQIKKEAEETEKQKRLSKFMKFKEPL